VLKQGSAAPDVEHLGAEADGEDGLAEVVSVLEEELVDVFAGGVGGVALLDGLLAVLLGVDVGGAAGEEDAVAGGDELGGGCGRDIEWDLDGSAAGAGDGLGVLGPGPAVVVGVGGGGERDGDAGRGAGGRGWAWGGGAMGQVRGSRFEVRGRRGGDWY
jgi:hypothetical protein